MRTAVVFHRLGPYHAARLSAAARTGDTVGVEASSETREYEWDAVHGCDFERVTVVSGGDFRDLTARAQRQRMGQVLHDVRPDVDAVPGWSSPEARQALAWCEWNSVPMVVMSASTADDFPRTALREGVKSFLLRRVGAALVGGTPHREYLTSLGMAPERIFLGYDTVDNEHFRVGAAAVRAEEAAWRDRLGLPRPFFLASNRFIPKKNLATLLDAYARYRQRAGADAWDMVLLGDGPLRADIEAQRSRLGLEAVLHLPGFKQYDDLPRYYGLAGAFVHASTTEQWGLVINEAMAAGLPVIVSERCGCVRDLVDHGTNGFRFDPRDGEALTECLVELAHGGADRAAMGVASQRIISGWGPDRFASALASASAAALRAGRWRRSWSRRLLIGAIPSR